MGQSLVKNYVHIVFSTKHRRKTISEDIAEDLFAYIGGICKNLECNPIIVGGYQNHIHILCTLSKKIALMTLLEKAKANSSNWIKTKGDKFQDFYWQNGYGCFSVNYKGVDIVSNYISNQKQHHQRKGFEEEYLNFLEEYQMEYDEKYIWD